MGSVHGLYYSPKSYALAADPYVDLKIGPCPSVNALKNQIRDHAPDLVYLRVSPHTLSESLIHTIHQTCPDARLIIEFYDASPFFSEWALKKIFADDQSAIDNAKSACDFAYAHADLIISKMGGETFDAWCASRSANHSVYFPIRTLERPQNVVAQHQSRSSSRAKKLIYAGSMTGPAQTAQQKTDGANILPYITHLDDLNDIHIDIYNAADIRSDDENGLRFKSLEDSIGTLKSTFYHPSVPPADLLNKAVTYDLGLCCAHLETDMVMDVTRTGIPNRMTSYLSAGLPVVIDDRFEFAADLIKSHGAGLVIPAGDFSSLKRRVERADLNALRAGVASLKDYMNQNNQIALEKIVMLSQKPVSLDVGAE